MFSIYGILFTNMRIRYHKYDHTDDAEEIGVLDQAWKLVSKKRAIVHAHCIRRTNVKLRSWFEDGSGRIKRVRRYEVEDEENDAILEDMGQLY